MDNTVCGRSGGERLVGGAPRRPRPRSPYCPASADMDGMGVAASPAHRNPSRPEQLYPGRDCSHNASRTKERAGRCDGGHLERGWKGGGSFHIHARKRQSGRLKLQVDSGSIRRLQQGKRRVRATGGLQDDQEVAVGPSTGLARRMRAVNTKCMLGRLTSGGPRNWLGRASASLPSRMTGVRHCRRRLPAVVSQAFRKTSKTFSRARKVVSLPFLETPLGSVVLLASAPGMHP